MRLSRGWAVAAVTGLVLSVVAVPARAGVFPPFPVIDHFGVVGWGFNLAGNLGDGTQVTRTTPVAAIGLAVGMRQVSAGDFFSLAVDRDGRVWSWGDNSFGQLGDGTTTTRWIAAQVPGLTGVKQVSAGEGFALALRGDGTVWAWGYNAQGQLGNGGTAPSLVPGQVAGLTGITAIAAGGQHGLALRSDGRVMAWGGNFVGQLGDGTTIGRTLPALVPGIANITRMAAGRFHNLALVDGSWVTAWGYNASGQLGDGTTVTRLSPVPVSGIGGPVAGVAAAAAHSIALRYDGIPVTWGANNAGQLGDGTYVYHPSPVAVVGLSGVTAVEVGGSISVALRSDGTVWTWGLRPDPTFPYDTFPIPWAMPGLTRATAIDAGGDTGGHFVLAVRKALPVIHP